MVFVQRFSLFVASICLVVCSAELVAQDIFEQSDRNAKELAALASGPQSGALVKVWRYIPGDVSKGWDPALDDDRWSASNSGDFQFNGTTAWMRAKVTLPAEISGCEVAGNAVLFKCGTRDDDEAIIYVNGKMARSFYADEGRVLLCVCAVPGDEFCIAIQASDKGGDGRVGLNEAWLELRAGERISVLLSAYNGAKEIYDVADKSKREPYVKCILDGMAAVNPDALRHGNTGLFLDSLKTAESLLGRVDELAKHVDIHLIGHAHIDMNWLWGWPETLRVCKNTFSTATALLDEYSDFRFSQSQAALYLAMQQNHPEVFERIKERVRRGQWDVTATTWTEGDNNMSSGEAIVRSILYGKRYIRNQFGVESAVCWEPDTFGHPWTLPQILAKSGIRYYYFTRCGIRSPIFWWESPDGSRVLAYNSDSYSSGIYDNVAADMLRSANISGQNTQLWVYGVGDHGGGPTRAMIENARRLQKRPSFPKMEFDTASEYFAAAMKTRQDYLVWNSELNTVFEGCYTTHADMKKLNRESEALLPCAEKFSVMALSSGVTYPARGFEQSWRNTSFNQFHDLLCGTSIHESYDHSKKLYAEAHAQARKALNASLRALVARIHTQGRGIPVLVFNPLSWTRTESVEVESPFPGEVSEFQVRDANGKARPAQNRDGILSFTASDVPALGYKVFWASRARQAVASKVTATACSIENEYFKVTANPTNGTLTSIRDKRNNRELLPAGNAGDQLQILFEEPHGMSAWVIGEISKQENLVGKTTTGLRRSGPARASIQLVHTYGDSSFTQDLSLYDGVPRIDIKMKANWLERGTPTTPAPMLKVAFPMALRNPKATFEIPFGSVERPTDGREVPAQKWIDLSESGYGVSLLNNCKYGFDVNGSTMRMTLLRSSYEPDPTPDLGKHDVTYSLYPHTGNWRTAGTVRRGYELNEPLIARVVDAHSGSLPSEKSFLSLSAPSLVVTALKQAEDGSGVIVRFYESAGIPCKTRVSIKLPARYFVETDLMEKPIGKKTAIRGGVFSVPVGKWEIKTYKLIR